MPYNTPTMPTYPHIQRYREELDRLIQAGGSDSELNIRPAFQNCLAAYCDAHKEKLTLVPELSVGAVRPDGTVKDTLRMARGYWEAKDTHDNLDQEIQRKLDSGYPRDNIIFEDSRTAVLVQNREEAMRVDMNQPGALHRLIRRFLDYELPQIEEFRSAQSQFKADLPTVIANLREAVEKAEADNPDYRRRRRRLPGAVPPLHRPRRILRRRARDAPPAHPHQGHLPPRVRRGPVPPREQRRPSA